jgi:hypothetical protein
MFDMRLNARRDILETLAPRPAPGGAEAREIILFGLHVALVSEIAGFQQHLEERVVPANVQRLAVPHVIGCESVIARVELRIAFADVGNQPARRRTLWDAVALAGFDGGKFCGGGRKRDK